MSTSPIVTILMMAAQRGRDLRLEREKAEAQEEDPELPRLRVFSLGYWIEGLPWSCVSEADSVGSSEDD
jgi:hypothetical protein